MKSLKIVDEIKKSDFEVYKWLLQEGKLFSKRYYYNEVKSINFNENYK